MNHIGNTKTFQMYAAREERVDEQRAALELGQRAQRSWPRMARTPPRPFTPP